MQDYTEYDLYQLINKFEKISSSDPNYWEHQFDLAFVFELLGRSENAIEIYNKISYAPNSKYRSKSLLILGHLYYENQEYDKSISCYSKISKNDERYDQTQIYLADSFFKKGKIKEAIHILSNISINNSKVYAQAQLKLGLIYNECREFDLEIAAYNKISREYDEEIFLRSRMYLSSTYKELGKLDKAISEISGISPEDNALLYLEIQFILSEIYREQNNFEQEKNCYVNIYNIDTNRYGIAKKVFNEYCDKAHLDLSLLYERNLKVEEAIKECKQVSSRNIKNYVLAQSYLFLLLSYQYQFTEAKKCLAKISKAISKANSNEFTLYYDHEFELQRRIIKLKKGRRRIIQDIFNNVRYILNLLQVRNDNYSNNMDYDSVAHYTRPSTAFILTKNCSSLRLSTIKGVNDPTEGSILFNLLGLDCPQNEDSVAFISCFTFNQDSLNQFRLYGKEDNIEVSGVSMVFDTKKFFDCEPSNLFGGIDNLSEWFVDSQGNEKINKLPLFRCLYVDPHSNYIKIARREEITFYRDTIDNKSPAENWESYCCEIAKLEIKINERFEKIKSELKKLSLDREEVLLLNDIFRLLRFLVKHSAFREEQECRIVYISPIKNDKIRMTTEKGYEQMYVEYSPSVVDSLKALYLSIGAQKFRDFFSKSLNLPSTIGKCQIYDSINPFRNKDY